MLTTTFPYKMKRICCNLCEIGSVEKDVSIFECKLNRTIFIQFLSIFPCTLSVYFLRRKSGNFCQVEALISHLPIGDERTHKTILISFSESSHDWDTIHIWLNTVKRLQLWNFQRLNTYHIRNCASLLRQCEKYRHCAFLALPLIAFLCSCRYWIILERKMCSVYAINNII